MDSAQFESSPQPPPSEIKTPVQSIEALFNRRHTFERIIQQTWQRRIVLEGLMAPAPAEDRLASLSQPLISRLFTAGEIANGEIVPDSKLGLLLAETDLNKRQIAVEQYLLEKAAEQEPSAAEISMGDMPAEIFAQPDMPTSLGQAVKVCYEQKQTAVHDFLPQAEQYPDLVLPLAETVLAAEKDRLSAQLAIRCLSSNEDARKYLQIWVRHEKQSGSRIVFTPSYRRAAEQIRSYEQRNGKNRTIARSLAYGPPGRGKSEFYRAINRQDGKDTMVISGRPFLGYEELVAMPQIAGKETSSLIQLASLYKDMDALTVTQRIIDLAKKQADRLEKLAVGKNEQLTETEKKAFRENWLRHIGLNEEQATLLSSIENPDTLIPRSNQNIFAEIESVKKVFVRHLLSLSDENILIREQESSRYLQGLIITADKLGMRVLLDEAEKMFAGQEEGNQSFAGLEDILTRKPGETIRIGNIEHRFSDDFFIDISMNERKIPAHIISRFGERAFYFEETPYDRVGITKTVLSNENGETIVNPVISEKLIYLLTSVWPTCDQFAQSEKVAWDLRTLQNILSALAHEGRLRGVDLATALNGIRQQPIIEKALSRFEIFSPKARLSALLGTADQQSEEVPVEDPFESALLQSPNGIEPLLKMHSVSLSPEEVDMLMTSLPERTSQEGKDGIMCRNSFISLQQSTEDGVNHKLLFTLPTTDELLYRSDVSLTSIDGDHLIQNSDPLQLVSASSNGNSLIMKKGKMFFVVDTTGLLAGDTSPQKSEKIARIATSPVEATRTYLSNDGSHFYWIENINGHNVLKAQKLGWNQLTSSRHTNFEPYVISSLANFRPENMEFSKDGNFALISFRHHKDTEKKITQILALRSTERTQQTQYLLSDPLPGNSWQLSSFGDSLFIFDTLSKQGVRIS